MRRTPFANICILVAFILNSFGIIPIAQAQELVLPKPGVMVHLSPEFNPPILKGIKVYPDNPFRFDFILDKGDANQSNEQLKEESSKLIKYFLASLTVPEKDLWVNLSPYEKDRIVPESFGMTEMGRDLLSEDYMLKQITASLIYPEDAVGKKFWKKVYEEAQKKYGTTNIPVNTFNKVWIVPEKASIYENVNAGTAYVVESKLKVMLEQDYLSLEKHEGSSAPVKDTNQLGSQIVREVVIPELTKEVNENENFVRLRQVYNSLILATWYKKKVKDSILNQVYANQNKIAGVSTNDPKQNEKIYEQYLKAFKKGVYNYIKDEKDPMTLEVIPRKYFSGGMSMLLDADKAMVTVNEKEMNNTIDRNGDNKVKVEANLIVEGMRSGSTSTVGATLVQNTIPDSAMTTAAIVPKIIRPEDYKKVTVDDFKKDEKKWLRLKRSINIGGAGESIGMVENWLELRESFKEAMIEVIAESSPEARESLKRLLQSLESKNWEYPTEAFFSSLQANLGPEILNIVAKNYYDIVPGAVHKKEAQHLDSTEGLKWYGTLNFDPGVQKELVRGDEELKRDKRDLQITGFRRDSAGKIAAIQYVQMVLRKISDNSEELTQVAGSQSEILLTDLDNQKSIYARLHYVAFANTPFNDVKTLLDLRIPVIHHIHGSALKPISLITDFQGTGHQQFPEELEKLLIYFLSNGIDLYSVGISTEDPDFSPHLIFLVNAINNNMDNIAAADKEHAKKIRAEYERMFPVRTKEQEKPANFKPVIRRPVFRDKQGLAVDASGEGEYVLMEDAHQFLDVQVSSDHNNIKSEKGKGTATTSETIRKEALSRFTANIYNYIAGNTDRIQRMIYISVLEAFKADPRGTRAIKESKDKLTEEEIFQTRKQSLEMLHDKKLLADRQYEDLMGALSRDFLKYKQATQYVKSAAIGIADDIKANVRATSLINEDTQTLINKVSANTEEGKSLREEMYLIWSQEERLFNLLSLIHNLNIIDSRNDLTLEQQKGMLNEYVRIKELHVIFQGYEGWNLDEIETRKIRWMLAASAVKSIKIELMVILPNLPIVQESEVLEVLKHFGITPPVTEAEQHAFVDERIKGKDGLVGLFGAGGTDGVDIVDAVLNTMGIFLDNRDYEFAGEIFKELYKMKVSGKVASNSSLDLKYIMYMCNYLNLQTNLPKGKRKSIEIDGKAIDPVETILRLTSKEALSPLEKSEDRGWLLWALHYRTQSLYSRQNFKVDEASKKEVQDLLNQALELMEKLIADKGNEISARELRAIYYVISGFMKYYTFFGSTGNPFELVRIIDTLNNINTIIDDHPDLIGDGINKLSLENRQSLQAYKEHLEALNHQKTDNKIFVDETAYRNAETSYKDAYDLSRTQREQYLKQGQISKSNEKLERMVHAQLGLMQLYLDAYRNGTHYEGSHLAQSIISNLHNLLYDIDELESKNPHRNAKTLEIFNQLKAIGVEEELIPQIEKLSSGIKKIESLLETDRAMSSDLGGIDLTPDNLNLRIQNNGNGGIKFSIDPDMFQRLQYAPGFVPQIINIQPMTDLRKFLGLNVQETASAVIG